MDGACVVQVGPVSCSPAVPLSEFGKIQGDGSQISSLSLNGVHIYQLQLKSATKGDFFHIFLSLIVSSWCHGLQMVNEANKVLLGKWPL